ncbi:MAG: glycosyltransferase [Prevotella sp.]|nr:glycosyltransferase [Prevotella sp.]
MNTIKLSIIIPSYNQGQFLEETILSIINQKRKDIEIIIIDGGSSDNSVEIVKKYKKYITYWQSKKDKGQSDAINQGVLKAKGDYVTWLNSDDVLLPNSISIVIDYINKYPDTVWFLGNVLWMNKQGTIIKAGKVEQENWFWNKKYLFSNGGPSAIMKRQTLIEIGLLREDFHYMMDTELWKRFVSHGYRFKRINSYLWGLRLHENAKMSGHNFSNSPLANENHPSWKRKKNEVKIIDELYPTKKYYKIIWRFTKLFCWNYTTRLHDRLLIDNNYTKI